VRTLTKELALSSPATPYDAYDRGLRLTPRRHGWAVEDAQRKQIARLGDNERASRFCREFNEPKRDTTMESIIEQSPPKSDHSAIKDGGKRHYQELKELGDCYAAVGDGDSARACYLEAAELVPSGPEPHVGLGTVALQAGNVHAARAAFEQALQRDDKCADAYGGLAMVFQQQQAYEEALDMYLRCLELEGDNLVALLGLFQTSCQMGTFAKVIHYLELYLNQHPGDTSVLFCLATLYAREGQLSKAGDILLNVLALEPDKTEAGQLLAEVQDAIARGV